MTRPHLVRAAPVVLAVGLVAACSTAEPDALVVDDTTDTVGDEIGEIGDLPIADFGPASTAAVREYFSPALGGVRFAAADDHTPATIGDSVIVFTDPPNPDVNGPRSEASIQLVTQSIAGSPVPTVDAYLDAVGGVAEATVAPTGDVVELFGRRLRGYRISTGGDTDEPRLFSSDRLGAPVATEFSPFPFAVRYLADTPAGVLSVGIAGADEVNARESSGALATLLSSAELTGGGLDARVPNGEVIESTVAGAGPDIAPLLEDGPEPLEAMFAPVVPGRYQVPNTGRQVIVEVGDGWMAQPNFPGLVVLTGLGSIGPTDRDLVMIQDVVEYVSVEPGPVAVGSPVPIVEVETLIENPPPGFEIVEVERVARGDVSVTHFEVNPRSDAACPPGDPCGAMLLTSYGRSVPFWHGFLHHVWWISDGESPPTVFVASSFGDRDFMDRAAELVGSLEFP